MNTKRTPLVIIGTIIVIAIVGIIIYAARPHGMPAMQDMNHDHSESNHQSSTSSDAVATNKIEIQSYAFSPATITVKKGTTVTWTNHDDVKHTVTTDDGTNNGPKSKLFGNGESYSYTFDVVGTYDYHCEPHPYMKGTVIVTE